MRSGRMNTFGHYSVRRQGTRCCEGRVFSGGFETDVRAGKYSTIAGRSGLVGVFCFSFSFSVGTLMILSAFGEMAAESMPDRWLKWQLRKVSSPL